MSEPAVRKRGRRGSPESWSVDAHVGQRVRMRRTLLGMSQEKLGEAIGLTFQQVQKYERGSNRISAGTLYRLSQVLDVPVSFFFDCYDDPHAPAGKTQDADGARPADSTISRREARLLRLWRAAPESIGDEMLSLLGSLSPHLREARDDDDPGPLEFRNAVPAVVVKPAPKAAGGKPRESAMRAKAETAAQNRQRRRHGAVWDPADIYRAGKPGKTPTS